VLLLLLLMIVVIAIWLTIAADGFLCPCLTILT